MESIENIKSVYQRIEDEARCELELKYSNRFIASDTAAAAVRGRNCGIILFLDRKLGSADGHCTCHPAAVHSPDKIHNRLFHRKDYSGKEAEVNRQELAALDYDTSCFDGGEEFADPAHLYAYDLDVFGTHSLFQYINRTCTEPGRRLLADWLGQHLTKKEDILERQAAVRELAPELKFRQRFRILGLLHKGKTADETELKAWAASPGTFRKSRLLRVLPATVTGINGACLLLVVPVTCRQVCGE